MTAIAGQILQSPPQAPNGRANRKGMALLGLAGVMACLVILLVATVVLASWVRQSGKERLTCRTLDALALAVQEYHQAGGEFPPTVSSNAQLVACLNSVEQSRAAVQAMQPHVFRDAAGGPEILDGWARPLSYALDSTTARPQLFSQGQDPDDPADNLYAASLGSEF